MLKGTNAQNAILRPVFTPGDPSFIAFPWDRITDLPHFPVPVSWEYLNDGTFGERAHSHGVVLVDNGDYHPLNQPLLHGDEDEAHAISRPENWFNGNSADGRYLVGGVFWTDGRIKIDIRLESNPAGAREVLSAEIAHAVDYGLPMTDAQKTALTQVLHPGGADAHTWWERVDYGAEYYTLVGEAWMALFTHSYSGMTPWQDPFLHQSTLAMAPAVHQILGIVPVDGLPPPPPPPFTLAGRAWRTRRGNAYVELIWQGATGERVTIWRNGQGLTSTKNDGKYVNALGNRRGVFHYILVDATTNISNEVILTV